jgi:hypothetical protein
MKAYNDIVVRDLPPQKRREFRSLLFVRGYTLRDAVIWFMDEVLSGRLSLPERGRDEESD